MPLEPKSTFANGERLDPYYPAADTGAIEVPVKLVAGETYEFGTVLGQVTPTNEEQTITVTASGGTYTLSYKGATSGPLAYNANATAIQNALTGLGTIGAGNVAVTGTGPYVVEFQNDLAGEDVEEIVVDDAAATGGTVTLAVTTPGEGGRFAAYDNGNNDGTEAAKGFLKYTVTVDDDGNHHFNTDNPMDETHATMWTGGYFDAADLKGLDANALADLNGRVVAGTLTNGLIKI